MKQSSLCQPRKLKADSQQHALTCSVLSKYLSKEEQTIKNIVKYSDIFGNLPSQSQIKNLYQETAPGLCGSNCGLTGHQLGTLWLVYCLFM